MTSTAIPKSLPMRRTSLSMSVRAAGSRPLRLASAAATRTPFEARRRVFVSLPKRWHLLTPQRYVRYTFFRCYIRFYSKAEVEQLAAAMKPNRSATP